jgi:hypothetical protein
LSLLQRASLPLMTRLDSLEPFSKPLVKLVPEESVMHSNVGRCPVNVTSVWKKLEKRGCEKNFRTANSQLKSRCDSVKSRDVRRGSAKKEASFTLASRR